MSHMRRIDNYAWAFPGHNAERKATWQEPLGSYEISAVSGVTFPGNKRTGMPSAAIQRRAMALADVTGAPVTMTRGEHYGPMDPYGRIWIVMPAEHSAHATLDGFGKGWLVTVSEPDGIAGWKYPRTHFRTWPAVLAFLREHFPHDAVTD